MSDIDVDNTHDVDYFRRQPTIRETEKYELKFENEKVRVWLRKDSDRPRIKVDWCAEGPWERIGEFRDRISVVLQRLMETG